MKSLLVACLSAVLLATTCAMAQTTKSTPIAVASSGSAASSEVGAQLGRSSYFLLFDSKGSFVSAEANPYKDSGNAGIPAVEFLAGKGVKVVVAEGFGGRIVEVMKEKGIRPVEFKGAAQEGAKKAMQSK